MTTRARNDRIVEPEILDALPHCHPDAIRSRSDLRLINALMGNQRWIERQLAKLGAATRRGWDSWELGAGDGAFGQRLARRFGTDSLRLTGLDLAPRTDRWPTAWQWCQADLLAIAEEAPPADLIIANLMLHHFQADELARIGRWLARAKIIIAVEPLRATYTHLLAYVVRFADINHVTREDGHISINAGFRGGELPESLGLSPPDWDVRVQHTPLGAYRLVARRRTAPEFFAER